jgi:hypothetical protein
MTYNKKKSYHYQKYFGPERGVKYVYDNMVYIIFFNWKYIKIFFLIFNVNTLKILKNI